MTRSAGRAVRLGLLVTLAAGLAALAGCSGGLATATGKVTFKGKPVTTGTVVMIGPDGMVRYGTINADGTYTVADVGPGAVKVGVSSPNTSAEQGPGPDNGRGKPAPKVAPKPPPAGWVLLPANYGSPDGSGLTATLSAGANTHDITLN